MTRNTKKKFQTIFAYQGAGALLQGIPTRDLTEGEWNQFTANLDEGTLALARELYSETQVEITEPDPDATAPELGADTSVDAPEESI